jgi:hypothetical protein
MSTEPEHSRIIAAAAVSALQPLGLNRKGRSRTWLDDQAWWLGIVEFQPSSWSKGTYLNAGVMWLWNEFPYLAYNVGGRVEGLGQGFAAYSDEQQFKEVAAGLARRAADEVSGFRKMFRDPSRCAAHYESLSQIPPNSFFDAGVVFGLSNRTPEAEMWFQRYLAIDDGRAFVLEEKTRVRELLAILRDEHNFKRRVRASIARTRELLHLPVLADWPF